MRLLASALVGLALLAPVIAPPPIPPVPATVPVPTPKPLDQPIPAAAYQALRGQLGG